VNLGSLIAFLPDGFDPGPRAAAKPGRLARAE
jgi:hypothetical protein